MVSWPSVGALDILFNFKRDTIVYLNKKSKQRSSIATMAAYTSRAQNNQGKHYQPLAKLPWLLKNSLVYWKVPAGNCFMQNTRWLPFKMKKRTPSAAAATLGEYLLIGTIFDRC